MSLFDRLRPDWKHSDADVRADAVRQLSPQSKETLSEIASTDDEPKVRQLAIKKLEEPALLRQVAAAQSDNSLRQLAEERATHLLAETAAGADEAKAREALGEIRSAAGLAKVALSEAQPAIRNEALSRLDDDAALLEVIRHTQDPALAQAAVGRLDAGEHLLAVAKEHAHGEVAVAALERIDAPQRLVEVAEHGAVKAVRQRAEERLDALPPEQDPRRSKESAAAEAPPAETADGAAAGSEGEETQWAITEAGEAQWSATDETPRAPEPSEDGPSEDGPSEAEPSEAESSEAAPAPATPEENRRQREVLCATVEALRGEALKDGLHQAKEAWAELEKSGAVSDEVRQRFEKACAEAEERFQEQRSEHRWHSHLAEVIQRAEELSKVEKYKGFERKWRKIQERWQQLTMDQPAPEEVAQSYATATAAVETRREQEADRQVQRRNDNFARLNGLTERVESLAESEELDLRKAQRFQREAQLAVRSPGPLPPGEAEASWPELKGRLEKALEALIPKIAQMEQEEEWKRWANVPLQEELCAQMEALVEHEDLAHVAREMRRLSNEWKKVASAPPEKSEELWQRFRGAREKVRERTKDYFEEQKKERQENLEKKTELCEKVEAIADSTDWRQTAEAIKALQAEWKKIGPVPRKHSDTIWKRFRKSCDHFFNRRKAFYDELHKERLVNLEAKKELCEKVEAIADSTDWEQTTNRIKGYQAQWKEIGPVPRKHSDAIWKRFRKACDRFFDRRSRRHEVGLEDNLKARRSILEELEALLPQPKSSQPKSKQPKEAAQAEAQKPEDEKPEEPKAPVEEAPVEKAEATTEAQADAAEPAAEAPAEASAADDSASEEPAAEADATEADEQEASGAEASEQEASASEDTAPEEPAVPENVAERIQELRGKWNSAGEVPERHVAGLQKNYSQVTDRLVAAYGEQLQGTDLDPEVNDRKREQIVDELEKLVADTQEELKDEPDEPSLEDLASQLKQALAANTIRGAGGAGADDAWKRREQKAQRLEERFKKLPGKAQDELMVRLSNARLELAALKPKAS